MVVAFISYLSWVKLFFILHMKDQVIVGIVGVCVSVLSKLVDYIRKCWPKVEREPIPKQE